MSTIDEVTPMKPLGLETVIEIRMISSSTPHLTLLEYHPTGTVVVLALLEHTSPPLLPLPNFSDADPPRHALVLAQVYGMLWEGC